MHEGQLVVVTGKLDERVRKAQEGLPIGTLCCIAKKDQVWVLLLDGNIWIGHPRDIAPYAEQAPAQP